MEDDKYRQQVLARMDIIIRLLLAASEADSNRSIAQMARQLEEMNLSPAEIGAILGKPSNYISATLGKSKSGKDKVKDNG